MKMSIKKKKAFTLVELLVVIAILAILASVSVVGYLGFTAKANLSNDQQMIKMMNDNLLFESVEEAPKNAGDAIQDLFINGFDNDKLNPFSKNHKYAYDFKENKMYLLDENDNIIYPEEKTDKTNLWGLYGLKNNHYIADVNNYVALDNILNVSEFNYFLGENKNINIDLNNNIFGVEVKEGNTVKVNNGSVISDTTVEKGDNIEEKNIYNGKSFEPTNMVYNEETNSLTLKDLFIKEINIEEKRNNDETTNANHAAVTAFMQLNDTQRKDIKELNFVNCTIDGKKNNVEKNGIALGSVYFHGNIELNGYPEPYKDVDVNKLKFNFDDCVFIKCFAGIIIHDSNINFNVTNCVFVTPTYAGIQLYNHNTVNENDRVIAVDNKVTGCTFVLGNGICALSLQATYSLKDKDHTSKINHYCADKSYLDFSNNKLIGGKAVLKIHYTLLNQSMLNKSNTPAPAKEKPTFQGNFTNREGATNPIVCSFLTTEELGKYITISNNELSSDIKLVGLYHCDESKVGKEGMERMISFAHVFTTDDSQIVKY